MNRKKVVIGLSGGVDSSTAAFLLKRAGYEVVGITLNQNLEETTSDIEDAKKIAKNLGIKHFVLNIREEFEATVIKYFVDSYNAGKTPSPCVICDDEIKFKKLFELADEIGAYYVATGHYTSVEYCDKFKVKLLKGIHNIEKDQSYMLYRIAPVKLERLIFPLKEYSKPEIRELAKENNLIVHSKKDSQGICFAKEGYKEFLKSHLKDKIKKGNYIDKHNNILGQHEGYQYYTLGQRRGLGINLNKVVFITNINPIKNEITLGEYKELYTDEVEIVDYKFSVNLEEILGKRLLGRPRYSSRGFYGKLYIAEEKLYFKYEEENPHNADGQHLVLFYQNFVIGGGIIVR